MISYGVLGLLLALSLFKTLQKLVNKNFESFDNEPRLKDE